MPQVDRFTVSLDPELLAAFDRHIAEKGYENRSEAIRDLIRDMLISTRLQESDQSVAAVLTVVCDHRTGDIARRVRDLMGETDKLVRASTLFRIDEHRDGLIITLKGSAGPIQTLSNQIQAMRGITQGRLTLIPINE